MCCLRVLFRKVLAFFSIVKSCRLLTKKTKLVNLIPADPTNSTVLVSSQYSTIVQSI